VLRAEPTGALADRSVDSGTSRTVSARQTLKRLIKTGAVMVAPVVDRVRLCRRLGRLWAVTERPEADSVGQRRSASGKRYRRSEGVSRSKRPGHGMINSAAEKSRFNV
jgi:hypothetical protein